MPLIETQARDRIRELNDTFRKAFDAKLGKVVMTAGVSEFGADIKVKIMMAVQAFSEFSEENDPHGEHDFGSFELFTKSSPFLSLRCQDVDVDLGAFGRGHALQRIDLYPVRAHALSSHNRYSRLPKARKRRWRTKLLLGRERPSIFPVANRLAAGAASSMIAYQSFSVAPSGMMPASTKRHRAIASFRASATMPTFRPRIPLEPNRSRHQIESLLSG